MHEIVKKIAGPSPRGPLRILVGAAADEAVPRLIGAGDPRRMVALVADRTVATLHAATLRRLESALPRLSTHLLPTGESQKSREGLAAVHDFFAAAGLDRGGLVVAVGGGVTSDLAGFAAATWMRGVPWVVVPTTLEATVDAAIGGKTGINLPAGKNLIGAFHQPEVVVIDPRFLSTLPERDLRAGLAESLKHALIADATFLDWQESNLGAVLARDASALEQLVTRNCEIKAAIVCEDERESHGRREALNFGHTIGHALESAFEQQLRHGECVAVGLVAACEISAARGLIGGADVARVRAWLTAAGLPTSIAQLHALAPPEQSRRPPADDELLTIIARDKKHRAGRRRFVVLRGIGSCFVVEDVSDVEVNASLRAVR